MRKVEAAGLALVVSMGAAGCGSSESELPAPEVTQENIQPVPDEEQAGIHDPNKEHAMTLARRILRAVEEGNLQESAAVTYYDSQNMTDHSVVKVRNFYDTPDAYNGTDMYQMVVRLDAPIDEVKAEPTAYADQLIQLEAHVVPRMSPEQQSGCTNPELFDGCPTADSQADYASTVWYLGTDGERWVRDQSPLAYHHVSETSMSEALIANE